MSTALYPAISERTVLFLVGAVQFVNILDFMMVMPLGPDFGQALGIANHDLGWIGGSYTAASAFAGLVSSLFIDKLDRKVALMSALAGLMIMTLLGGFAWNFESLLFTRILAGMCGGPATSVAWSIVADTVEPARRGQAMGKVMGAFSMAAVFGVPFGLELAQHGDWRTPFYTTAVMGALVLVMAHFYMPSMRAHLKQVHNAVSFQNLFMLLRRPISALTYAYITIAMIASFMIIPNISAYVQFNLHYPRTELGWLYSIGGVVSFITMRWTGWLVDRYSAAMASSISAAVYVIVLWVVLIQPHPAISVMGFFVLFMFAMGMRNVSSTTLASKIPSPAERAGFMSLLSCMQGIGMAFGAFLSTRLLTEAPDKSLIGIAHLAQIAMLLSVIVPILVWRVEHHLKRPQ